jgi:para-nitrobenzyl esterase
MQPCFDEYVLPQVEPVFKKGDQARVPLLCGWNGDEYGFLRAAGDKFDANAFRNRVTASFGTDAEALLSAYGNADPADAAAELASDRAMVWPTWKWAEEHAKRAPVFVYQFDRAPPDSPFGATHASELEYVFGALDSKPRNYVQADYDLSEQIGDYWIAFVRSGDPNGKGPPIWPRYGAEKAVLHLDAQSGARPLAIYERLTLLDRIFAKRA